MAARFHRGKGSRFGAGRPGRLPDPVPFDPEMSVAELWERRLGQVIADTYAGVPLLKLPEDLRVYEHIIWSAGIGRVIELGNYQGGSTLWFRDRLRVLRDYGRIRDLQVIAIDLDIGPAERWLGKVDPGYRDEITLIAGDVTDPGLPDRVGAELRSDAPTLVIDDSAHTFETTTASLRGFSGFVTEGSYFVVEDGCVDVEELRVHPSLPRGVIPAVKEWLETPQAVEFRQRRDLELYGLTCHPQGYLQRVGPAHAPRRGPRLASPEGRR
jgi:cephalosporin hydroxylase